MNAPLSAKFKVISVVTILLLRMQSKKKVVLEVITPNFGYGFKGISTMNAHIEYGNYLVSTRERFDET